jgi:hypothetical protein
MKTVLAALILVISGTAQARVLVQNGNGIPQKLNIEQITLGRGGEVSLVGGTTTLAIPKAVIESTGLTTQDFIELMERYNRNPSQIVTLSLRNYPDGSVGRMSVTIGQ